MNRNHYLIIFLALGVFGLITMEMGVIGVLPQVTQKFHISPSQAGSLVSIFAFIVAISGPFMTLLASGINRKIVLLTTILMFAISSMVYAFTTKFEVMLAFRIIPAIIHPVYLSIALVTAAQLVPAEKSSKAVSRVFAGLSAGFAFGVPLTSYFANKISLEVAFLFGAVISFITFIGILVWLPSMPVKDKMSIGNQLSILRKPRLWIANMANIFIFAAMFAVYSYFAEYVGQITRMNGSWISMMLLVFGVTMIVGNFLFESFLHKNMTKTVVLFPLLYMAIYLFIYCFGSYFLPMVLIVFIWGVAHSGGIIVGQSLLMAEAKEAPEFGNSLFVSFSNVGIAIGTLVGGWFISHFGIHQFIWSGIMFALLTFLSVILITAISRASHGRNAIGNQD
ncbi:MFS transporter [Paenibacillus polymyxa]|uniref:MFS transporter n=1 Tax=Paenibacillus polymyxa TaxID=1406 RepID=UPI0025B63B31|nr:MFS transporter [Paenibacillus polymyxa]MDN4080373.1 MFS transporter [Paenibacillus polymyxa]MDN4084525.1 MFS transporter [Paenibacillus polymyxa]MDN4105651.1 MFS transporter [Paenibacillus polymyxa]MDN4110841.1 MFS transporter [Paenibacillus polymyxa]MDN4115869.1 MFS transporter [Paenibacillus polymyxa]